MEKTAPTPTSNWIFYCLITGYFCLSLGLNNGFILGGLTAFDTGFLDALDITVAQLKLRDSMTFVIIGIFAVGTGVLVDKFGAIRVLITGHVLFSIAFWLLSKAQNIETIYAAQAILGLCQLCAGYLVCVIAVSRYLPFNVGLAVGLMMASTSLANAFLPKLNFTLIERFGASQSLLYIALSAIPLAIGAALISFAKPRGAVVDKETETLLPGPTLKEALLRRDFWAIIAVAVFSFSAFVGIVTNIGIFAANPPFSDVSAAGTFFQALFMVSLVAQVVSGWIADKMRLRLIHIAGLLCMAAAFAGLAMAQTAAVATAWFALLGLGWGFNYVLVQVAVPARFAGQSLGKIFGTILVAEALSGAAAPFLFGAAFDAFGSYKIILLLGTAGLFIAIAAAAVLHTPIKGAGVAPATA